MATGKRLSPCAAATTASRPDTSENIEYVQGSAVLVADREVFGSVLVGGLFVFLGFGWLRYPVYRMMVVKEDVFDFSDFDFSGFIQGDLYKNAISAASGRFDYMVYREEFGKAAELAKSSGESSHAEAFLILAGLCSMMLCPELQQNPFKPMFVGSEGRSLLPEDLSKEQVSFLGRLIDVVDDVCVKARLAELLWLMEKPKNKIRALVAIESYLKLPLSPESWIYVSASWTRAIVLSISLRELGKVDLVRHRLLDVLLSGEDLDAGFLVGVARVLRERRLHVERTFDVAERLEIIANRANKGRGYKIEILEEAAEWFGLAKVPDRKAICLVCAADLYVEEAEECLSAEGAVVARARLEVAIKKYRSIPREQRSGLDVDNKIDRFIERQREIGISVAEGMQEVCISSDVTEFVEKVKRGVSGKDVISALIMFVIGNAFPGAGKVRDQAVSIMKSHPIRWMFPGRRFSSDGRLVAKHPPVSSYGKEDKAVECAAAEQFRIYVNLHAYGFIYHALLVIRNEHWLTVDDFEYLARESSLVPGGREKMWAIGLHAGYEGDFVVALHVLVPQIENMVRVHLKEAGVSTSTTAQDGVDTENGLSTLVKCPEAVEVFGEDLLFELKYLLCSPFYSNIRNEMAHGLLSHSDCYSEASLYCWWLSLRLVLVSWWNGLAVDRQNELWTSIMNRGRESDC